MGRVMGSDREYLLVDGNNIIHAWPELKDLHLSGKGLAHEQLRHLLEQYQDVSGVRVVLVFDGRGENMESGQDRNVHEIQVMYTDSSHTADDIIEKLAARYAGSHRITVATNDLAEQNMVYSLGAEVVSAEGLRQQLENYRGIMDDWLKRYRRNMDHH